MSIPLTATADVLAPIIGVSRSDYVCRTIARHGIEPIGREGRRKLYAVSDLMKIREWSPFLTPQVAREIAIRRQRSDRGVPRGISAAAVTEAVTLAKSYYLSAGMPDLRMACDNAIDELVRRAQAGETPVSVESAIKLKAKADWFYRRWVRRKDEYFRGPYHKEGWAELWRQAFKQHDSALRSVHAARSWWQICESAGWAGEGFGYGRMIALDDRTADVWSVDPDGKPVLAQAIYVWDVLTGALMWIEATPTITTQAYVRAILSTVLVHGLKQCPAIVLENARAAKGVRIQELVEAMYTREEIDEIRSDTRMKRLWNGQEGPIYRNVPHIAREIGKAMAERSFGTIKREHDSLHNAAVFQGGNRNEAVQMHRSNQPWQLSNITHARMPLAELKLSTVAAYIDSVWSWAWSSYLERHRGSLMHWGKSKHLPPNRASMVAYYGGTTTVELVDLPVDRWAMALFAATPSVQIAVAKVRTVGAMTTLIGGQPRNLVSAQIGVECVGRRVLAVPVPGQPGHWAVALERPGNLRRPERFLGYAQDLTATTVEQAIEHRATAQQVRREIIDAVDAEIMEAKHVTRREPLGEHRERIETPLQRLPEWVGTLAAPDAAELDEAPNNAKSSTKRDKLTPDETPQDGEFDEEIQRILDL